MTVKELIALLSTMPPDAHVFHLWDGSLRTKIEHVWLARSGDVATADHDEVCYSTEDRPIDAPTEKESRYWRTPDAPKEPKCGVCDGSGWFIPPKQTEWLTCTEGCFPRKSGPPAKKHV